MTEQFNKSELIDRNKMMEKLDQKDKELAEMRLENIIDTCINVKDTIDKLDKIFIEFPDLKDGSFKKILESSIDSTLLYSNS